MELSNYRMLIFGGAAVLFVIEICVFVMLRNRLLAELLEKLFGITRLNPSGFLVNFSGIEIDFQSSQRFRISLICQLAVISWINILLFIDGCVMHAQHLYGNEKCPQEGSDCFILGSTSSHERISCQSDQMLFNSTATSHILCFVLIYDKQNATSILNQMGICSSVFSLLCYTLKVSCRLLRHRWGLILQTILALALLTFLIVSIVLELRVSMTARLLTLGSSCLLINLIQLFQFIHHRSKCRN
jgi:hypothetical protein